MVAEEVEEEGPARRLERLRAEAQQELLDCQLGASWLFTTVGAFTGTAAGIYLKRMQPLFALDADRAGEVVGQLGPQ